MPLGSITEALPATAVDVGPGPEVWSRYSELLTLQKPTVGQQREFVAVAKQLGIVEPVAELHKLVLLVAAARKETLRDNEAEAEAAELAAFRAEAAARKRLQDEIIRLQWRLGRNDFPEARAYASARNRCGAIKTARDELAAVHASFPELFGGIPAATVPSWSALTHEILGFATKAKIFHVLTRRPSPAVIE
jgi:hypothetical protein